MGKSLLLVLAVVLMFGAMAFISWACPIAPPAGAFLFLLAWLTAGLLIGRKKEEAGRTMKLLVGIAALVVFIGVLVVALFAPLDSGFLTWFV